MRINWYLLLVTNWFDRYNAITANQNKISNEVFKYEDFLKWCVEWKENTSWLLFLRHIQKLILQEINEDGDTIVHLEINTENPEEILKYNNEMREEFSPSLLNTCKKWKSNDKALPLFIYKNYKIVALKSRTLYGRNSCENLNFGLEFIEIFAWNF